MNQHSSPDCVSLEREFEPDFKDVKNIINETYDSNLNGDEDIDLEDFVNEINNEDHNKKFHYTMEVQSPFMMLVYI